MFVGVGLNIGHLVVPQWSVTLAHLSRAACRKRRRGTKRGVSLRTKSHRNPAECATSVQMKALSPPSTRIVPRHFNSKQAMTLVKKRKRNFKGHTQPSPRPLPIETGATQNPRNSNIKTEIRQTTFQLVFLEETPRLASCCETPNCKNKIRPATSNQQPETGQEISIQTSRAHAMTLGDTLLRAYTHRIGPWNETKCQSRRICSTNALHLALVW